MDKLSLVETEDLKHFFVNMKRDPSSFLCVLHQKALCARMCGKQLGEVMSLVIQVVNFIVAWAEYDFQFKTLLEEVGNNYPGLLMHSNVRWVSRGKVLSRFAACLRKFRTFHEMKRQASRVS